MKKGRDVEMKMKKGKPVFIYGRIDHFRPDIITMGNHVVIGVESVVITHCPVSFYKEGKDYTINIGNNVFVGMGCYILPGTKIGDNVIIGAGSVVTGTIPSNCIAAGNPCKFIRSITEKESQRLKLMIEQKTAADGREPVWS